MFCERPARRVAQARFARQAWGWTPTSAGARTLLLDHEVERESAGDHEYRIVGREQRKPPEHFSGPTSPRAAADASTAAITTGTTAGRKSSGSMTSRALVLTAMAENSVPTAAIPNVARTATDISSGCRQRQVEDHAEYRIYEDLYHHHEEERRQHLAHVDRVAGHGSQQQAMKVAAVTLQREGAREPQDSAEMKAVHNTPGATRSTTCGVGSMAKLNIRMTRSEKTKTDTTKSFVLSSSITSLRTIAQTAPKYDLKAAPWRECCMRP